MVCESPQIASTSNAENDETNNQEHITLDTDVRARLKHWATSTKKKRDREKRQCPLSLLENKTLTQHRYQGASLT